MLSQKQGAPVIPKSQKQQRRYKEGVLRLKSKKGTGDSFRCYKLISNVCQMYLEVGLQQTKFDRYVCVYRLESKNRRTAYSFPR